MGCHSRIDPYGFALEQYDAVGRIRQQAQDTSTTLFSGESLDGVKDLKAHLVGKKGKDLCQTFSHEDVDLCLGPGIKVS